MPPETKQIIMLAKIVLLLLLGCAWIVTAAIIRKVKVSQHGDGHYKTVRAPKHDIACARMQKG